MAKYRKTALIEATQWFRDGDHPAVQWWEPDGDDDMVGDDEPAHAWIATMEGPLHVVPGTWIAGPGAAGEFWPIADAVFRATYELVDE